jgi:hypothetical protein
LIIRNGNKNSDHRTKLLGDVEKNLEQGTRSGLF